MQEKYFLYQKIFFPNWCGKIQETTNQFGMA